MSITFYKHQLKNQSHFFTLDPGARSNGGTGLAFWSSKEDLPIETKQFGSLSKLAGMHDLKMEHILYNINDYFLVNAQIDHSTSPPCFIEEPQFFSTFKGETAAKSGALHKLTFFYGRLFQLVKQLGLKPIPLVISHWKGQMNKDRVTKKLNRLYPDNDWKGDIEDAVGMGLFLKGLF